jgi:hypothetical protein
LPLEGSLAEALYFTKDQADHPPSKEEINDACVKCLFPDSAKPTATQSAVQQTPIQPQSCPNGICIGGNNTGTATVTNSYSDSFPRAGIVPVVTMCANDSKPDSSGSIKKVIIVKTNTAITSPYWWFAFDGPVSDSTVELLNAKEPYGSTHGPPTPEQSALVQVPIDQMVGASIVSIGNPFGGPWRPLDSTDTVRITILSKNTINILHVEPGRQGHHLDEQIVFDCTAKELH